MNSLKFSGLTTVGPSGFRNFEEALDIKLVWFIEILYNKRITKKINTQIMLHVDSRDINLQIDPRDLFKQFAFKYSGRYQPKSWMGSFSFEREFLV
jgi:hypothetical protein